MEHHLLCARWGLYLRFLGIFFRLAIFTDEFLADIIEKHNILCLFDTITAKYVANCGRNVDWPAIPSG